MEIKNKDNNKKVKTIFNKKINNSKNQNLQKMKNNKVNDEDDKLFKSV